MIVELNGEDVYADGEVDEVFRVRVPVYEDGHVLACLNCGEEIDHDGVGGYHHLSPSDPDRPELCDVSGDDDDDGNIAAPAPSPLSWCNSASIALDPDGEAVHVSVSVFDPRGAFTMTVRRLPDGRIVLHLPHPGEPMPHAVTAPLHDGTLMVVG